MIELLLVRHAPAIRPPGLLYGSIDYPADVSVCNGRTALINALGGPLRHECWIASGLKRARMTGEAISGDIGHARGLVVDTRFDEQNFGDFEGMERDKIPGGLDGAPYWVFSRQFCPPNGESFDDVANRSFCALKEQIEILGDQDRVVIFTHGNVIRGIIAMILGLASDEPSRISVRNWGFVRIVMRRSGLVIEH